MKVNELIEYLSKCDPEYTVCIEACGEIGDVIIHTNLSDPNDCKVQLWYA